VNEQRVLFIGLGNLGSQILDLFLRVPGKHHFLIGGRNQEYLQERTNLSLLAAMQLGYDPDVAYTYLDLWNVDQTADVISHFRPSIIFCAATLQRLESIRNLPQTLAERLANAQMGPRLPLHLVLIYKLMQAIKQTGQVTLVLNAIYPDVVNPVLGKVGLAPTTGVGDLANNIPALRKSIALKLNKPLEQVDVRLFMSRYLSYRMSRAGNVGNAPFHLTALVNGKDMTHALDMETVFDLLPTTFKRLGGTTGLLMTATSASVVFEGIIRDSKAITHAPGPNDLPGGYSVQVGAQGVELILPDSLTLEEAISLNEAGLRFDGIERIDDEGTVYFANREMSIFKEVLGYECKRMPLSETEDWAKELQAKYAILVSKYS
jgi:hypothetical protein